MRGSLATPGTWHLLIIAFYIVLFFCHPIRNKLYVPLIFGTASVILVLVHAAVGERWAITTAGVCWIVCFAALAIQQSILQNRRRREFLALQAEAERDRKKRRRGIPKK